MKLLNKEQILTAKLKTKKVDVPEWGGTVLIREPDGLERADFELLSTKAGTDDNIIREIRGFCAAKCLIDEKGNRLFNDDEIKSLNKTSANALDRIIDAYRNMALIDNDDIEQAAKN